MCQCVCMVLTDPYDSIWEESLLLSVPGIGSGVGK